MSRAAVPMTVLFVLSALAGCLVDEDPPTGTLDGPDTSAVSDHEWHPAVLELHRTIEHAMAAGESVDMPVFRAWDLSGLNAGFAPASDIPVIWRPSVLLSNATWYETNGTRMNASDLPEFHVYDGHVEESPERAARLVITKEWASGSVSGSEATGQLGSNRATFVIRVNLDGNVPYYEAPDQENEDSNSTDAAGSTEPSLGMPRSMDRYPFQPNPDRIDPPDWTDDNFCIHPVPNPITPTHDVAAPPSAKELITTDLILDGDRALMDALGPHTIPWMIAQAAEVDAIFEDQTNIRYNIVGVHLNDNNTTYGPPSEINPLGPLAAYWNARPDVDRDIVHIITGHDSSFAQANCIGGAGIPETAYTFTPLNWARQYGVFHVNAFAHELGHIWSAHHHYGNHAESHLATIMIQGYTPGIVPVFSTMSQSVMRGWAETYIE